MNCHALLKLIPFHWTYEEFSGLSRIRNRITINNLPGPSVAHERDD